MLPAESQKDFFGLLAVRKRYARFQNARVDVDDASLILFWRVVVMWREEMAADNLNPTYEMWLSEEIAAGRIAAPGWQDPIIKAAWLNCRWIGSPMPNIDPKRTADADKAYIEMGAQTLDNVARNLNGSVGSMNRQKNTRQIGELAVPPWVKTAATGNPEDEKEDDDG